MEVFLKVSAVKSRYVHGKGLRYKASKRGMRGMVSNKNDELKALKDEVARLTEEIKAYKEHERHRAESELRKDEQLQSFVQNVEFSLQQNNLRGRQNPTVSKL